MVQSILSVYDKTKLTVTNIPTDGRTEIKKAACMAALLWFRQNINPSLSYLMEDHLA